MAARDSVELTGADLTGTEAVYSGILPAAGVAAEPAAVRVAQATANVPPATVVITLEDGNIARLPDGADISNARANGADLEFVQPDGTVIIIPGGAIANLVLFIGDIQIPAEAVAQIFATNDIQTAAGPEGGEPDGTGSYEDLGQQNVGNGLRQNSLLGDSGFGFGSGPGFDQPGNNTVPTFPAGGIFVRLSEEGLKDGNPDDDALPDDQTNQAKVLNIPFGLVDAEGNDLTYTMRGIPTGSFTSGGDPIVWELSADGTGLVGRAAGVTVVEVNFDNAADTYSITLSGPLDHLDPGSEDTLDLVLPIRVADYQNFSDSTLTLTIEDDSPFQVGKDVTKVVGEDDLADFNPAYPLVFDFWQGSLGTSPYDGNPADGITGLLGTVPVWGDLSPLVRSGADGPGAFSLVSETEATDWISTQKLTSKDDAIDHVESITIAGIGDAIGFFASDGRLVFGLFVSDDGIFNFRLFDQLDHDSKGADLLPIDLSGLVSYEDGDGDQIVLEAKSFVVSVRDDVPKAIGTECATLDEDDLANFNILYTIVGPEFWQGSLGTSPFDGFTDDGSITGLLGTVSNWGFLGDNVRGGADEFGRFDLVDEADAEGLLSQLGAGGYLESHGDIIDHVESINILGIGEAMGFFASDGRLVLGLYVDAHGIYNVRLFDQIDHYDVEGMPTAEQMVDFGQFVRYTDRDGDEITLDGHFEVKVVDDAPELRDTVATHVDEADLSNFNPLNAALLVLSPTGFLALPDYLQVVGSEGTDQTPSGILDHLLGTASQSGFLNTVLWGNVVAGGADEFGRFELVSSAVAEEILEGMNLRSNGKHINHVEIVDLGAIDPSLGSLMGFFASDGRLIFTLTVTEFGAYDIRLFDQIDHGPQGSPTDDARTLELGQFVSYKDFDGDTVFLDDHFTVTIADDEPLLDEQLTVKADEANLSSAIRVLGAVITGSDGTQQLSDDAIDQILGTVGQTGLLNTLIGDNVVTTGADEFGQFELISGQRLADAVEDLGLSSKGAHIASAIPISIPGLGQVLAFTSTDGRVIFTLSVNELGIYDVRVFDQIDHKDGSQHVDTLTIALGSFIDYVDADGDPLNLGSHLALTVADDHATIDLEPINGAQLVVAPSSANTDPLSALTPIAYGTMAGAGVLFSATTVAGADELPPSLFPFNVAPVDVSYTLQLGANAQATGLLDPSVNGAHQQIRLEMLGNDVVGRNGLGDIVLLVSINSDTGAINTWQYRPLEDAVGDATAEMIVDALRIAGTITDYDGSTHTDSVELGSKLSYNDSVPDITAIEERTVAMDWPNQTTAGDIFVTYGGDGPAAVAPIQITGLPPMAPDWVAEYSNNDTEVRVYTSAAKAPGDLLYTLTVASGAEDGDSDGDADDAGYVFTLHKPWPPIPGHAITSDTFPDGDTGTYKVGEVTFVGIDPFTNGSVAGSGTTGDGFGVQGAFNIDSDDKFITNTESFRMLFDNAMDSAKLDFFVRAIGIPNTDVTVSWTALKNGTQVDSGSSPYSGNAFPGSTGPQSITVNPAPEFDEIRVSVAIPVGSAFSFVQFIGLTGQTAPIPADDQDLQFEFTAYDNDGDADSHALTIHLDNDVLPTAPAGQIWVLTPGENLVGIYSNLQVALDAAPTGGFVIVGAGTYRGNFLIDDSVTLVSSAGRNQTIIEGDSSAAGQGTIVIAGGVDNVSIGDGPDTGFTIKGFDGADPGQEKAAVYLVGGGNPTNNFRLVGNEVVAAGEAALLSEWNAPITNAHISQNIFSGETFVGFTPAVGNQFTVANVARQLIAFGQGSNPATNPASGIEFIDNQVIGSAGGNGVGNILVTIDAANSLIKDNVFTGQTGDDQSSFRARGPGTSLIDNTIDGSVHQSPSSGFFVNNQGTPGTYSGNKVIGTGGDDVLVGTPGADWLDGGSGKDLLFGGLGNDTLVGGSNADTFKFAEVGAANKDTILDYVFAEGDKVDLSALLDTAFNSGSNVANLVKVLDDGTKLTVQVDVDGLANGQLWTDVVDLSNVRTNGQDSVSIFFGGVENNIHD